MKLEAVFKITLEPKDATDIETVCHIINLPAPYGLIKKQVGGWRQVTEEEAKS